MRAEIMAVGTELLLGDILNTNAQFLAQELANLGIEVYYQTVVGDNPQRLKDTIYHAFSRADLIITTGGLGPTEDDLTKETAAEYFGVDLVLDEKALARIQAFFDRIGRPMTENNVKQAMVPATNGIVLYNDNGSAPGIIIEKDGKTIVMLPGPPKETIPMFLNQVKPYLAQKQEYTFISRILRVANVGESAMAAQVQDIMDAQTNPTIAPYAKDGEAILRITAKAKDEAEANAMIDPVAARLKERLGDAVYAEGETDMQTVVAEMLIEKKLTVAVAESCTGGMIASRLIEYPGISEVLLEGCVTYSNDAKMRRLGVKAETL
ncbi:MAG: competence/damage-inducible protein A, partial [Anaerotignum sp.]|nr:competence/damage-inducible protein A [Anaerotignum sp.]